PQECKEYLTRIAEVISKAPIESLFSKCWKGGRGPSFEPGRQLSDLKEGLGRPQLAKFSSEAKHRFDELLQLSLEK
ncbi:MAG TPA: hypothetical protein V6D20_13215, partial [Candidatus Obscuribacterales bacterium]